MHKNFGEWHRQVKVEPNDDMLRKRWPGIVDWVSVLHHDDASVLETVRIFQSLPAKTSREPFLEAFRNHDTAFPQRNELELRVLAGAALVQCVQSTDGDVSRAAVIAGTALDASRIRTSDPILSEVFDEVVLGLQCVSRKLRQRRSFDTILIDKEGENAALEAMKQLPNAGDWSALRTHVTPILQAVLDGVRRSEVALAKASHNLRCADEETNILWWLEGGCSRDLDKPWSALKDEVPLTAAWELAELTDVVLGPQDVTAFLDRVVTAAKGKSKDQPLHIYVNAVSDEWARKHSMKLANAALDLTPLSLALSQRCQGDASSWQQFFEKTSGVESTKLLAPEAAARQAYVEAVLLRTLAEGQA